MKEKISGIVIGIVRHSDRHNVVTVFTRERGRMAFLAPAGAGRSARVSSARLQLLSVFEAQVNVSAARELQFPSSFSLIKVWRTLYFDPMKSVVVMFLSEFLLRFLRDAPPEPILWDFIAGALELFDRSDNPAFCANFHIAFLISLLHFAGIAPDLTDFSPGMEFDMQSGIMVMPWSATTHRGKLIDADRSRLIPLLSRMNLRNASRFRFSGRERSEILDRLLSYYGTHFPGTDTLRSPSILRDLFS